MNGMASKHRLSTAVKQARITLCSRIVMCIHNGRPAPAANLIGTLCESALVIACQPWNLPLLKKHLKSSGAMGGVTCVERGPQPATSGAASGARFLWPVTNLFSN